MASNPPSINEEAGLGPNWVPVDAPPIVPGRAAPPPFASITPVTPQYLQGSLPAAFQHDTSFTDTATQTPSAPKYSLMPLALASGPIANASIQSTITKITEQIIASTPSSSGGGSGTVTSVGLTAPSVLFSTPVPGSPVTSAGILSLVLLDEPQNFVFAGPAGTAGTIALDAALGTVTPQSAGTSQTINASGVTTQANDFALLAIGWQDGNISGSANPDASWTNIFGFPSSNVGEGLWWKMVSAAGAVSATASVTTTGNPAMAATIVTAKTSGGTPTIRQSAQQVNTGFSGVGVSSTLAYSLNVLAGSMLFLVTVQYSRFSPWAVTDSKGNAWVQLSSTSIQTPNGGFPNNVRTQTVWAAPSGSAGANTLTFTSTFPTSISGSFFIIEVTNLAPPVQTPIFRALAPADIPGMSTGLMSLLFGGTGANLIGTGGANQVVQQPVAGGPFTVGQLDYPNFLGTSAATRYLNANLQGNGLVSEVFQSLNTAQTANFNAGAAKTLFTPTAAKMYRVSFFQSIQRAATTSSTTPSLTLSYTDAGGIARTLVLVTSDSTNLTTTAPQAGEVLIYTNGSTAVTVTSTGYVSTGATTMQYTLAVTAEAL